MSKKSSDYILNTAKGKKAMDILKKNVTGPILKTDVSGKKIQVTTAFEIIEINVEDV